MEHIMIHTPRTPDGTEGLAAMRWPLPPSITVSSRDWQRTFAPGADVMIGRDARADIRLVHPAVSRLHLMLRQIGNRWVLVDNDSLNGMYVGQRRVRTVDIRHGDTIRIGNPTGPWLTFALDAANGSAPQDRPTGKTEVLNIATSRIGNVDVVFADSSGLEVRGVSRSIDGKRSLLDDISFNARPATLTAVIGPSGSGKSTLVNAIVGGTRPDSGTVSFEGRDVHAEYASLRSRIGMVPQDDVVHPQLTIEQALTYAAELRMPSDTTPSDRRRVIAQVLEELELTPYAHTRIDKLSGGQRKRTSVAMELLTGPSLLVLDEPTTGLDPALDQQVMRMLRHLADAGRAIVVVTHSLSYLDVCDQVLLLAPGGKTAFRGPPGELAPAMGSTDWADVFTEIEADPDAAQRRFRDREWRRGGPSRPPVPAAPVNLGEPVRAGLWRQFSTVARRQVRLIVADRGYLIYLALMPFVTALLPLVVGGDHGFGKPSPGGAAPREALQVVVLTNLGATFMGCALTIRAVVGERIVFRREQAAGLSASAYVVAKVGVFGAIAVLQSAVLVLLVTAPGIGKDAPPIAAALGRPMVELFVDTAASCVAAATLGLAVSALAQNSNQVLPLMATALTTLLVLAGGFIPVTDRMLDPISWLTPGRWGLAATASTADLPNLVSKVAQDSHWKHTPAAWAFDIAMLVVLSLFYACVVRWRIRPSAR